MEEDFSNKGRESSVEVHVEVKKNIHNNVFKLLEKVL